MCDFQNVTILNSFTISFRDAFAKLQKATIIFVMSVRPSAWNNSALNGLIFIIFLCIFENLSRKFKFH